MTLCARGEELQLAWASRPFEENGREWKRLHNHQQKCLECLLHLYETKNPLAVADNELLKARIEIVRAESVAA